VPLPDFQMNPDFAGRFYFRLTDAGNLLGEYSNTDLDVTRPESASRNDFSGTGGFAGDYVSTWIEPPGRGMVAQLRIRPKPKPSTQFALEWEVSGTVEFRGEAFVNAGLMIGNYWKPGKTTNPGATAE
jgi:hypothetical protein